MAAKQQSEKRLRWFCVKCDGKRSVPKAQEAIKRLGIKVFVPMAYRQERKGKWLVPVQDGYLFPPYIFVAMRAPGPWKSRSALLWGALAEVEGVEHIESCRNRNGDLVPLAIPYKQMRIIRARDKPAKPKAITSKFKQGQQVTITNGTFTGFAAVFDKPEKERVRVLLSLFGRQTEVVLNENEVRAA